MATLKQPMLALLLGMALAFATPAFARDAISEARARMEIEAQRIEKEFAEERTAAYRLVRSDSPKLAEAVDKLDALLRTVRADTSLKSDRRDTLIRTLKYDLDRVREIAAERRAVVTRDLPSKIVRDDIRRDDTTKRTETGRGSTDLAKSIMESRTKSIADIRSDRGRAAEGYLRVMRKVEESAIPENATYKFPKNWKELSARRSKGQKLTEAELAILKALDTPIDADFSKDKLSDVVDFLKKRFKIEAVLEKRALEEVGASYDSEITLKMKASTRAVLKRILSDLNLTYVVKEETLLITSIERAKTMTTTRSYYLGDLVGVADVRLPAALSQLVMLDNATRIIASITQQVDPQSWRLNNPDAVGTIVFDPTTMSIVVKQTAEIHYKLGGYR